MKTTIPAACFGANGLIPSVIANNGCVAGSATAPITVSPYILPLANLFPEPNVVGYPTFNYTFPFIQPTSENYGQIRFDHNFSASDSAFFRYTQDDADQSSVYTYPALKEIPSQRVAVRNAFRNPRVFAEPAEHVPVLVQPHILDALQCAGARQFHEPQRAACFSGVAIGRRREPAFGNLRRR